MPFDQYHEPPEELSEETRTFARICASLIEEAEAIGWYAQRLDVEKDSEARAIMENAQGEEFKHFAMNLEFLIRRTPKWREVLEDVLFKEGDIVEHGEQAEERAVESGAMPIYEYACMECESHFEELVRNAGAGGRVPGLRRRQRAQAALELRGRGRLVAAEARQRRRRLLRRLAAAAAERVLAVPGVDSLP